jgi:tetratricopeptide (TPR) repeat protein
MILPTTALENIKFHFMPTDRISTLNEILAQDPNNAFARYGLAMEYANSGEAEQALEEFGKLLSAHPDYPAGYFMAAQTLAKASRSDEAKTMLQNGIAAAQRKGDSHAAGERKAELQVIVLFATLPAELFPFAGGFDSLSIARCASRPRAGKQ